jgi:glycosyltransferase involved in cell wall biosynthesis
MKLLLQSSRVLVLPSKIENFAIVVAEALSFGVPCVVSRNVGTSETVSRHRAGEVISDFTPDSVSDAIITVLSGDQFAYRQAALRAAREDFNWSKIANDWNAFLRSLTLE